MKIVVIDGHTLNPGDLSWDELRNLGEAAIYERTPAEMVAERAADAGAILTNKVALRAETLARLKSLRYIGVTATGVDIIDLEAARKQGVTVTNVPAYGTNSVAQLTIALLLELCHHAGLHSDAVRAGAWSESRDWSFTLSPQIELAGKTMGVIGFGRIGRRVGEIARAMGMHILGLSPSRKEPPFYEEFEWATLDELLMASDVVSLHCPLTPQTRGLMDARRLGMMKPSALLLNTARGALIDAQALANALNIGKLAGAGLDVLADEPPPPGNPLFTAKNCILTPHMAWATLEARARCLRTSVENLAAFIAGSPQNVVSG
ncbi:MAG: D-2-hydroxyacid dehydrogenase [Acidobacteriota bacterium]|nr:D-2-hydroxyacid dehydrogenase [Acidobacteriota bacterium]